MSDTPAFTALRNAARAAPPDVALVLGSGMSKAARGLHTEHSVPFDQVPGLSATSVAGHSGSLKLGTWAGRRVLCFAGRLHYYEGHSWDNVVQPVRLAAALGVRILLMTNAAGGIHDALGPGSLMALRDHLEWTRPYCWRDPGPGGLGLARPSPYSPRLLELLATAAGELHISLHQGVYASVTGPCYETPAEIRALKTWGADAVGMSTAREVHTGFELGMECAAISCITNRAAGLSDCPINHEEVLTSAAEQEVRLGGLVQGFLQLVGSLKNHE